MARSASKMGSEIWESECKLKKASILDRFRSHFRLTISEGGIEKSPEVLSQ